MFRLYLLQFVEYNIKSKGTSKLKRHSLLRNINIKIPSSGDQSSFMWFNVNFFSNKKIPSFSE